MIGGLFVKMANHPKPRLLKYPHHRDLMSGVRGGVSISSTACIPIPTEGLRLLGGRVGQVSILIILISLLTEGPRPCRQPLAVRVSPVSIDGQRCGGWGERDVCPGRRGPPETNFALDFPENFEIPHFCSSDPHYLFPLESKIVIAII